MPRRRHCVGLSAITAGNGVSEMKSTGVPWLSIIVPTLNEASQLARTLSSVQPWRAQGVEVIVVDGGSHDETVVLANDLADSVLTSAKGRARQMNQGAVHARGPTFLFLHADTRLDDSALSALKQLLTDKPEAWGRFDVRIEGRSALFPIIAWFINRRSRWSQVSTGDQAQFFSRDLFYRVGKFPLQPLMEDVEICLRAKKIAKPVCMRQSVTTSGRRWERFGVWRTIWLMWSLRYRYWRGVPASVLAKAYR